MVKKIFIVLLCAISLCLFNSCAVYTVGEMTYDDIYTRPTTRVVYHYSVQPHYQWYVAKPHHRHIIYDRPRQYHHYVAPPRQHRNVTPPHRPNNRPTQPRRR